MRSPGCPLQHLLGVTPLPLDLSPENPCRTWDPRAKFRVLIKTRQSPRLHRSRPPTSAQLAGSASVLPRVSPPTPSGCNPVAFGLKPRESVPHLGPQGQISCFNQDLAKSQAPSFAPPTSAQLAGSASVLPRVSPPTPSRRNPVAFGL